MGSWRPHLNPPLRGEEILRYPIRGEEAFLFPPKRVGDGGYTDLQRSISH